MAILLLSALAPAPSSAAPSACPLDVAPRDPGWTSIDAPAFAQLKVQPDQRGMEFMAAVPGNPNILFAGNQREIFRTTDGGCHWTRIFPRQPVEGASLDCSDIDETSAGAQLGACLYVYDMDAAIVNGKPRLVLEVASGPAHFTAGVTTTIYLSDDLGETWGSLSPDLDAGVLGYGPLTITPSDPETMYVVRSLQNRAHTLAVTNDGGDSWHAFTLPATAADSAMRQLPPIAVDPTDPLNIWMTAWVGPGAWASAYATPQSKVLHSTDGGATWEVIATPESWGDLQSVTVSATPSGSTRVAVSSRTTIGISQDGGATWTGLPLGIDETQLGNVTFGTPRFVFATTTGNIVARIDLERQTATSIKSRTFADYAGNGLGDQDQSSMRGSTYATGSGYYILGECGQREQTCNYIYRYTGKGT